MSQWNFLRFKCNDIHSRTDLYNLVCEKKWIIWRFGWFARGKNLQMHHIYCAWNFTNTFIITTITAHKISSLSSKRALIYSRQSIHIKQSPRKVRSFQYYHSLSLFIITRSPINVFAFDYTTSTVVYNRTTWKQIQSHWISIKSRFDINSLYNNNASVNMAAQIFHPRGRNKADVHRYYEALFSKL